MKCFKIKIKKRRTGQGCQHFSTIKWPNKVYFVQCTHFYAKRWEFCKPCFKKKNIIFESLYTIVHFGVQNGSPGTRFSSKNYTQLTNRVLFRRTHIFNVLSFLLVKIYILMKNRIILQIKYGFENCNFKI